MIRHVAALLVALMLVTAGPAVAQDDSERRPPRTVGVTGEGTSSVQPDQATVRFGIVTRADEPEAAREQNATAAREALNAVRDLDVPERKIRLETLRLQPVYEYDQDRRSRDIVGYEAIRTVVVELDDIDRVPTVVARVVQEGANRLQDVSYGLQDDSAVRNEALREAVQNARGKAELLTQTLDVELGRVLQIEEQQFNMPMPHVQLDRNVAYARAESDAAPEPEAYAAGEIEVQTTVRVVFELE